MKKPKLLSYSTLWAGNDESWHTYLSSLSQKAQIEACVEGDSDEDRPNRLLSVIEDVAVISVHGTLVNQESWWNSFMGLVAYSEIVDALYRAALDDNIREVILDIASGGGAVNGVLDAVNAVERTNAVKRVTAFTSSVMCSAALWLAAPAKERYASAVATVGSIGVVVKHVEHSKAAEMEGIKETIIRAGKFKQLANASEPLSDLARLDLEEKAQYIYSVFVDSVASHLGVSYQLCDTRMADGKEFIGRQAADVGLINGVADFEDVFGMTQSRVNQSGGDGMKKRYMGAAAMAAASAGVDLAGAQASAGTGAEPTEGTTAAATGEQASAQGTPAEGATTAAEGTAAADGTGEGGEGTPVAGTQEIAADPAVDLLKAQLKEKDDALLLAKVDLAAANKFKTEVTALKTALAEVVNNMTVALGGSKDEKLAEAETATLLSLHSTMTARMAEAFKVGGIAPDRDGADADTPKPTRFERTLAATKIPQR